MSTLRSDESGIIAAMLSGSPVCRVRTWCEKIVYGIVSPEELMEIRLFLARTSEPCREVWALRRLYEDYSIRRAERRRVQNDPTTQESDRRALGKKETDP